MAKNEMIYVVVRWWLESLNTGDGVMAAAAWSTYLTAQEQRITTGQRRTVVGASIKVGRRTELRKVGVEDTQRLRGAKRAKRAVRWVRTDAHERTTDDVGQATAANSHGSSENDAYQEVDDGDLGQEGKEVEDRNAEGEDDVVVGDGVVDHGRLGGGIVVVPDHDAASDGTQPSQQTERSTDRAQVVANVSAGLEQLLFELVGRHGGGGYGLQGQAGRR